MENALIMVIDDDEIFQFTAKKTLQLLGIRNTVVSFTSSREALAHLNQHMAVPQELPDYVFLDINMPVMDGWLFMEELKKIKGTLAKLPQVYIVSSSIDPRDMQRAADNADIAGYVEKPISPDRYREILQGIKE